MNELDVPNVLRCFQCNKPFDKQSTLKRHGYYCRSRKGISITRARSCAACARTKARCDNRRPECSRCLAKELECHYPPMASRKAKPRTQSSGDAPGGPKILEPLVPNLSPAEVDQEASKIGTTNLDDMPTILSSEFTSIGVGYFDWLGNDIDFTNFLTPPTDTELAEHPSIPASSDLIRNATPPAGQIIERQLAMLSSAPIPNSPTNLVRALTPKAMPQKGAQRISKLILHTLRSYPHMMLRHGNLPPFLHPQFLAQDAGAKNMEPLTNCISLVHMISSGVRGSRKLFWRNVELECERIGADAWKFNQWELLTAQQALAVYFLIRLEEGQTDDNNVDYLILSSMAIISKQLVHEKAFGNAHSIPTSFDSRIGWKDWIYEESRRRLSVVLRVLAMLVHLEPNTMCTLQRDLVLAPLPSRKKLWEAGNESEWQTESGREPGMMTAYALTASGDLVKLDEERLQCTNVPKSLGNSNRRGVADWEEWCSGMDDFGGLVMLAASLLE